MPKQGRGIAFGGAAGSSAATGSAAARLAVVVRFCRILRLPYLADKHTPGFELLHPDLRSPDPEEVGAWRTGADAADGHLDGVRGCDRLDGRGTQLVRIDISGEHLQIIEPPAGFAQISARDPSSDAASRRGFSVAPPAAVVAAVGQS